MKSNRVSLKLFVVVIILSMFMVGCSGNNPTLCRQSVIDEMETYEVTSLPNLNSFIFIARTKDGAVWFVETMSSKATITAKTMILPPTNVNTNR